MGTMRIGLIALAGALLPDAADAATEGERVYAIQQRQYMLGHEFAAAIGVLPVDAFFKGLTFSGSYTYHFDPLIGWEVIQGIYSRQVATNLEDELETNFGVRPTEHQGWNYALSSSLVLKPLYGKLAFFNRHVIHMESFFVLGGSAAHLPSGFAPGGNVGAGLRFFPTRWFSVRFDVRDLIHVGEGDVRNDLWIALALALSLGGDSSAAP